MNLPDFTTGIHIMTVSGADLKNEPDREYVIVCFDVEKFKFVNDRFGLSKVTDFLAI